MIDSRGGTGSLLVAGTTSDAGKSLITAGICRWLARQGVRVAPFKAQNMSNNSMVVGVAGAANAAHGATGATPGVGAEIGRAQVMQAQAAGVEPEVAMNPVLLKPGSDRTSQVVLLGQVFAEASATSYQELKPRLREAVLASYQDLKSRFDVVICEGAGSPTEINLRDGDLVNMGLAQPLGMPVVVVGDIDRGGVFAAFHGTVALLDAADQKLVSGFIINKFRGDPSLLTPGLRQIEDFTGRPVFGVVPWLPGIRLDAEDALPIEAYAAGARDGALDGGARLRVAVVRFPRVSNFTDVDALAIEPGVDVEFTASAAAVESADLVVLPGTKSTVADLAWLRERGLEPALAKRAAEGRPILGICGGYQMLGTVIEDEVESRRGTVAGLGLLPVRTVFDPVKTLTRPTGFGLGEPVGGYEIHNGQVRVEGGESLFTDASGAALEGCQDGAVWGTIWHGALESDGFRRAYLAEVARVCGLRFEPDPDVSFAAEREKQLDRLGDAVEEYVDTERLWRLIEDGPTAGLPLLPPGAG
ncbi:cobyric acid synthase CobQ [Catenulispora acidiphila DSM 44928]|uniref:Cobyric acid synthase n=1 Tax=Catenulispora acidiphila (strain DSM 44928 / JCM 14897 / NBRC 102108 / NRRL B-24433 / ID139908) TaxID=479433 RepID=C7QGK0_CATAD|nr:cobyric acid synthase [Catenulispora acidiphila]ACU74880.1 cobyric acid synthase CobQ [Catenulispora acidiphila DSM 44928]